MDQLTKGSLMLLLALGLGFVVATALLILAGSVIHYFRERQNTKDWSVEDE